MFEISVSPSEKRRLVIYAEHTLFEQSHWGDGDMIIPEEQFLYDEFKSDNTIIDVTNTQLKILINWFLSNTGCGSYMMEEDMSLLDKIVLTIESYFKSINPMYQFTPDGLNSKIELLKTIVDTPTLLYSVLSPKKECVNQEEVKESEKAKENEKSASENTPKSLDEKIERTVDLQEGIKEADKFVKDVVKKYKKPKGS